jgi:hypothetical protein
MTIITLHQRNIILEISGEWSSFAFDVLQGHQKESIESDFSLNWDLESIADQDKGKAMILLEEFEPFCIYSERPDAQSNDGSSDVEFRVLSISKHMS